LPPRAALDDEVGVALHGRRAGRHDAGFDHGAADR
jgi:hypothetical protein